MGDAGSQDANAGKFFGLNQLHFLETFFGYITQKNECSILLTLTILDRCRGNIKVAAFPLSRERTEGNLNPFTGQSSLYRAIVRCCFVLRMKEFATGTAWKGLLGKELRADVVAMLHHAAVVI